MARDLLTINSFASSAAAHLAKSLLEVAGIAAYLSGEEAATSLEFYGSAIGGVKLQVAVEDAERAREVLAARQADMAGAVPSRRAPKPAWECAKCGQRLEAEFDVCWSCGTSRDGVEDPNFCVESPGDAEDEEQGEHPIIAGDDEANWQSAVEPGGETGGEANPFASPRARMVAPERPLPLPEEVTDPGDEIAARAFRGAVFGLMCPPLLSTYSCFLLLKLSFADHPLSRRGTRQYYWAWVMNMVTCLGAGAYLVMLGFR